MSNVERKFESMVEILLSKNVALSQNDFKILTTNDMEESNI